MIYNTILLLYHAILYYTILYDTITIVIAITMTIPYHHILYYAVIYHTIPYHNMLQPTTIIPYTRSPLQDSRLFGPSPWKILAATNEQYLSEQPSPWRKYSKRKSCYGDRVYHAVASWRRSHSESSRRHRACASPTSRH